MMVGACGIIDIWTEILIGFIWTLLSLIALFLPKPKLRRWRQTTESWEVSNDVTGISQTGNWNFTFCFESFFPTFKPKKKNFEWFEAFFDLVKFHDAFQATASVILAVQFFSELWCNFWHRTSFTQWWISTSRAAALQVEFD